MTRSSEFTFFYTTKSPFSQFHPAKFVVDRVTYSCAEQFMMHQKAVLFKDDEIAESILAAEKPGQMKALGRGVRGFDEKTWGENRMQIVKRGNLAKFRQNTDIKTELLSTSGTTLVEASPRDKIWGIGLGADNPAAFSKKTWRGQNLLGYILTDVRDEIISEEEDGKVQG